MRIEQRTFRLILHVRACLLQGELQGNPGSPPIAYNYCFGENGAGGAIVVHTVVDGTYRQTNLTNESSEYLVKREELRLAEIELMRQRERIADRKSTRLNSSHR